MHPLPFSTINNPLTNTGGITPRFNAANTKDRHWTRSWYSSIFLSFFKLYVFQEVSPTEFCERLSNIISAIDTAFLCDLWTNGPNELWNIYLNVPELHYALFMEQLEDIKKWLVWCLVTDIAMDWSDHALWWPARNMWLTRTRSTLDQYGVQADALLHFTPMHKTLRVQLPDLRYLDCRVNFSIKTFNAVVNLCKELGKEV